MSVYFDNNASTPLHPEVLEAMMPFLTSAHGNASSLHRAGRFQRSAIEQAREQVAKLVNVEASEVIFTSGGSEANNLALKGILPTSGRTVLASPIEHASVLEPLQQLADASHTVRFLSVDENGVVELDSAYRLLAELSPDLLSVQLANNETGVIQPVAELARFAHQHGCGLVHSDASQAAGRIEVDAVQLDVDLLTLSAHKFQGPQGAGALILRSRSQLQPLLSGGHQEAGRRAGTENVAAIVGMGKAAQLARINLQQRQAYLLELRSYFERQLLTIPGVSLFGQAASRLPNTSFFAIPYYHGETLLMQLDQAGFELASGSACHSEVTTPSHVLTAMAVNEDIALNAVRVSFGMDNTRQQVDALIKELNNLINQLPPVMRQVAN